jgi:galactofuranose transport system substrate-binding protein
MHRRTILTVLLAAAAAAAALAQPADAGKKLVVGFAQVGAESAWRTAETQSIKDEAEQRGIDLKFADAQGKQANQIRSVRSFIQQKVDCIILAPKEVTGWDPVLKEARDAKIPVILVDRGIQTGDDSIYTTLIASDFVEEGRRAAEWLADKTGGKATIVELQGTTGSAPAIDRNSGFVAALQKHPEMTIIKSQPADFERAKGKQVMEAFIKSEGKKITAVYAHNDDMALGAIQALEEAGMNPGKDVIIVSIDGVKAAFEAMVEGKLNCTVECNPMLGPIVFDTMEKILRGETVPKFIKQEDQVFDQTNAKAALPSRKY